MKADPSLEQDYVQIYQKELPVQVKSQSLSFEDVVMLRIFKDMYGYKLEMTSEMNVSFFYTFAISEKDVPSLADEDLKDVVSWFKDIFSGAHRYQLAVKSVETAQLVISQSQKFKSYELACLQFSLCDELTIKQSIMYRYQRMKLREKMLDQTWQSMCGVVRTKNPSLLLQMEHRFKRSVFR